MWTLGCGSGIGLAGRRGAAADELGCSAPHLRLRAMAERAAALGRMRHFRGAAPARSFRRPGGGGGDRCRAAGGGSAGSLKRPPNRPAKELPTPPELDGAGCRRVGAGRGGRALLPPASPSAAGRAALTGQRGASAQDDARSPARPRGPPRGRPSVRWLMASARSASAVRPSATARSSDRRWPARASAADGRRCRG